MTFFFDNHPPPELLKLLRQQGVDAVHLREQFSDRGLDDAVWIPEIAARGWVLITGDQRIRSRQSEKLVFQQAELITFFLVPGYTSKTRKVQIAWLLRQWPKMEVLAATAQPGDCFLVPQNGKIKKLDDGGRAMGNPGPGSSIDP